MARRSQCSSAGDNPLDPNYLPPHYREEYRLAVDALVEEDLDGYYQFLQKSDVVDFLSSPEIQYIQSSIQVPQQHNYLEQHFVEPGVDGSSDTYWPIHSDLDAPGLDLGWPQLHHFIGPTEVTTLVNPPEPNMPSIKEQARRLIKNAQQVVAIVMDMFTDVDMFADILDASMRNVAVYILLDKQNAHHFVNMVSNCRVNLQNIQLLRVRIVSGITYHCRSGKSFNGQMMDRFLLTDCRAVLSGNYSFMWSFEKLHRCMAHLFLGQLVSTFDEEFRILFAQSEPLVIENFTPMEELSLLQKRQYPSERKLHREPKKFQPPDTSHLEEWPRYSYDERMDLDWRMMPQKKQEYMQGPVDMYGRFKSQQSRMDPCFDHGPSRMPMMENLAFKRHSFAEGTHGRYSFPFLQQKGMPEPENQGRHLYRGQQPGPGPGKEAEYSGNDKFWNQDFYSGDQYSDPGFPQEMEPNDNFDPVLNYLSSTRIADLDQGSDKLLPTSNLPFGSSHTRRLNLGQPHACQTSPTPSNPTDQKQYFQEPSAERKDPMVKRGLRNWRISSYLSAYDNQGDEGLPSTPPNAPDPFEDPTNPIQQTPGIDLSLPKVTNVREFRIPAVPRASQIPSYAKTTAREQLKKDEGDEGLSSAPPNATGPFEEPTDPIQQTPGIDVSLPKVPNVREFKIPAVPRARQIPSYAKTTAREQPKKNEDEGLPSAPPYALDPCEEPSNLIQEAPDIDLSVPKIPNVREFKIPAVPRASHIPSYAKTTAQEQPNKLPDEPTVVSTETKTTPTSSESSFTTEVEKIEEAEQKEPKIAGFRREESFRRKYNAAVPRSSRLRSSLIFSSLEQQHTSGDTKAGQGQQDEESDKNEAQQTKLPFVSQMLGQRRTTAREPFEWSRYMKSATFDNSATDLSKSDDGNSKPDNKDSSKDENSKDLSETQESSEPLHEEQAKPSPSMPQSKASKADLPRTDQSEHPSESLLTTPLYVDMSDPDNRLMFFKELAAKRKATKASEAEKNKEKASMKSPTELKNTTVKKEEPVPEENLEKIADTSTSDGVLEKNTTAEDAGKTVSSVGLSLDASETSKQDSQLKPDLKASQSCKQEQTRVSADSKKMELKSWQSAETETTQREPLEEPKLSNPAVITSSPGQPPTPTNAPPACVPSVAQGTDESESSCLDSTSKESCSLTPSSVEVPPSSAVAALDSNTQCPESVQLETSISSPALLPEQHTGSELSSSNSPGQNSSFDHILPDPGSQINSSPSPSSSDLVYTPAETISSTVTPEHSTSSTLSPNVQDSVSPSPPEPSQLTSSETLPAADSAHVESDISPDTCAAGSEPNTSSSQPNAKTEESCDPTSSEKDVPESENNSVPKSVGEKLEVLGSSKDVKGDSTLPSLSPSLPESCLLKASDLESISRPAENENPTPTPTDTVPKHSPAETRSPVHPGLPPNASQPERQSTPPSELHPTEIAKPSPAETVSFSSQLTESVGSVLSPEADKTLAASRSVSDTSCLPKEIAIDATETPMLPSAETSSQNEPTSKDPIESDLPGKTPESVTSESQPSEAPAPAGNTNMDSQSNLSKEPEIPDPGEKKTDDTEATNKDNEATTQESDCNEKTNEQVDEKTNGQVGQINCSESPEITSDETVPSSPQSKQPKSNQSRYLSSTANVLSSSNLRDDTKLLLGQISANSQSRNEAAKEAPVTDDDKEDKADKNAKREKERGIMSFNKEQPNQEREKLLEKIQNMRKERKVYSRFEMAPYTGSKES